MASESATPDPGRRPRFTGPPPVPGPRPAASAPEPAWQAQAPPPPAGTWRPAAPPPPASRAPAADVAPVAAPPVVAPPAHDGMEIRARRPIRAKRSSDMAGLLAIFVMLLAAAGGLGYFLLWQQQQEALRALRESAARADAAAVDAGVAAATPVEPPTVATRRRPAKDDADSAGSGALDSLVGAVATTPRGDDDSRMAPRARPVPPPMQAAPPPAPPATRNDPAPSATPSSEPAVVEEALRAAYAAMCGGDFAAAAERLEPLSAGDDAALHERLERWRRLLHYARGYADLREKAYAVAGGREYDLGDRVIVVVEIDDERIVYRDSGKQRRLPRSEVPDPIDRAIVEQWLGSDGRAANHLFIGANQLAKERPSPADATREWRRATSGGEADGRLLEPLVNDPVIVGGE